MLRVIRQNITGLKYPVYASVVLSFASLGDAFLYAFLPQHAISWGIPVVWVGLLLSINRLIRILFNPFVLVLFARYGVRQVTIVASCTAILSTMGYGLGWGLASLIIFRMLWGISFAVLRIGAVAHAFAHTNMGISLGTSKSIQELGPVFALWTGPLLLSCFSDNTTFFLLALLSLPSLLYAYRLPHLGKTKAPIGIFTFKWPSLFNSMTFFVSFIVDGILIVILGVILTRNNVQLTNWMVTSIAAGLLAYRRICLIFFSPVSGVIADKIGFNKVFNVSVMLIVGGIAFILAGWEMIGLLIIFAFNSINSAMSPGGAANKQKDKLQAVTTNAGWRDTGAATGTLAGGFFLTGTFLFEVLIIAIFILAGLLFLNFIRSNRN
jgi:DHA1 family multidrug resistance protein-like MFS transporter